MQIISLGYLEDGPLWFVKLSDSGIEEENKQLMGLDKQIFLSNNEQKPTFDNSNVEQIRKKKTKAERQRIRQNILANMFVIAAAISASWFVGARAFWSTGAGAS